MISFFWIVYFADGTALAQFDETGQETLWRDVEAQPEGIVKAGWYPFTPQLARALAAKGTLVRLLPQRMRMEVELGPDCELVLKRVGTLRIDSEGTRKGTIYVLGRIHGDTLDVVARDEWGNLVTEGY